MFALLKSDTVLVLLGTAVLGVVGVSAVINPAITALLGVVLSAVCLVLMVVITRTL